jgi:hypothetical protein
MMGGLAGQIDVTMLSNHGAPGRRCCMPLGGYGEWASGREISTM